MNHIATTQIYLPTHWKVTTHRLGTNAFRGTHMVTFPDSEILHQVIFVLQC